MRVLACLFAALAVAAACEPENSPRLAGARVEAPPAATAEPVLGPAAFSPIGHPAGSCVTEAEIAAEQAIRLHAALMVTGLTCHGVYGEPTLFDRYQEFTLKNGARLNAAQQTMSGFLARYGGGNGARLFDTYQTEIANTEALLVAEASAPAYCRLRQDQYYAASDYGIPELDSYIDRMADRHRAGYRVCR